MVGTDASGADNGEVIINDIGPAVGGAGQRRMTIANDGNVTFTGNVYAAGFAQTSSASFKTNIRTFENALETVNRLRGVRFDWKKSGQPAVGLIAEEVDQVLPELVAHEGGAAKGVNYRQPGCGIGRGREGAAEDDPGRAPGERGAASDFRHGT